MSGSSEAPMTEGSAAEKSNKNVSDSHSRVKIVVQKVDPNTGERIEHHTEAESSEDDSSEARAFTVKKVVYDKFGTGNRMSSEIDIKNPALWELLKKTLGHYPYHIFRGPPVTLNSPFAPLVFNWDVLAQEAARPEKDHTDKVALGDLKLLLEFVSSATSGDEKLVKYFQSRDTYLKQGSVQFDDLWTIFPPGSLIYGKPFQGQHQVFVVQGNKYTWPRRDEEKSQYVSWKFAAWTYDWTGREFERTRFTIAIEPFDGHRPIASLQYHPFDAHPDRQSIEQKLVERGKRFREFCTATGGGRLFDYTGWVICGRKGLSSLLQSDDVDGRVMVDYDSYLQYSSVTAGNGTLHRDRDYRECLCDDCQVNEGLTRRSRSHFDKSDNPNKRDWEDERYMLCPPRVLGYILGEKQWAQLQVSLLKKVPFEMHSDAWSSRLQLAEDATKDLLLELVKSHVSNHGESSNKAERCLEIDDIIPHKGKGLIVLLYGPPGVGKTSTAEIIALATRKPLFSISVADVGTDPKRVEANLAKIFALATSWEAILLIDEADVFLESRGKVFSGSIEKNALVSVFLRVLDYYQGIMFLTTNQIAQFDVAIPSRIHVAIKYESLTKTQATKIFEGFLKPLEDNDEIHDYERIKEYLNDDVLSIRFDGRQIRNIITTALGIARAESGSQAGRKGKLKKAHLKKAVQNARAFKEEFVVQYDRYKVSQEKMIQV
ncbi:hypothetical protein TruAng_000910 [Truncatella angustata]|nr:hypothetical protein TruAng_000910 [Truncatella angustata]